MGNISSSFSSILGKKTVSSPPPLHMGHGSSSCSSFDVDHNIDSNVDNSRESCYDTGVSNLS